MFSRDGILIFASFFVYNMDQNQQGGDNSTNLQAGRDINFNLPTEVDKRDFGIIDEIFKSVVQKLNSEESVSDRTHVNLSQKIEINFHGETDRNQVREYFGYAYTKVSLIEKRIQEEGVETQNDLHSHIFGRYNSLKQEGNSNLEILEALFQQFIIPGKENNPEYNNLARAFVLFFFDDCTIFEKTDSEK